MLQITQLKLPVRHSEEALYEKAAKSLSIRRTEIKTIRILKKSIDARDKNNLCFVYSIACEVSQEKRIIHKTKNRNIQLFREPQYHFGIGADAVEAKYPPIIVGSGPAGLFCAWILAKNGYRPLVLERGDEASKRRARVNSFWNGGSLDPDSNVQFGEGGAGTFSDGKLNTGVHDKFGRNSEVLRIFVQAGAPEQILYDAKPHLGTDYLVPIVEKMRQQILDWGGSFRFRTKVTDLLSKDGVITGVKTADGETLYSDQVVLAIGHSARDTFEMLTQKPLLMEAKPFAVGVRVEHLQEQINRVLYGPDAPEFLGAAPYKLTRTLENGRGVYSFCMCPGGYVVNAASEPEMLAVNGMSYHGRNSANANSAIVVSVNPVDFAEYHIDGKSDILNGLHFQRTLEQNAYALADGAVPVQRFADFERNQKGSAGALQPCIKGAYDYANVRSILPDFIGLSIISGMHSFEHRISGYADGDTLISGVESRTSSPIRIVRDENLESTIRGLYPCGEGAGYAGGITSAAMDGLKVAEAIAKRIRPFT